MSDCGTRMGYCVGFLSSIFIKIGHYTTEYSICLILDGGRGIQGTRTPLDLQELCFEGSSHSSKLPDGEKQQRHSSKRGTFLVTFQRFTGGSEDITWCPRVTWTSELVIKILSHNIIGNISVGFIRLLYTCFIPPGQTERTDSERCRKPGRKASQAEAPLVTRCHQSSQQQHRDKLRSRGVIGTCPGLGQQISSDQDLENQKIDATFLKRSPEKDRPGGTKDKSSGQVALRAISAVFLTGLPCLGLRVCGI
ncbi:hypothetical protein RRG08_041892 [Elysia crispata]|uniref:Uncharacterized protein n=1 Tax=Elysia crispata TaxID=231223 RepID=A0AAE0Y0H6_9GAST|nr:hypothetical protein RRG08_041892 [Elysia crispata]